MSLQFKFLLATYLNLNLGPYWLLVAKQSWKYNSFFVSLLLFILCTWPSKLRFFSKRISAIDESPAHWLEMRSDLHPVRVPRLLILTEDLAPPGLNTLTDWYNRYKAVWLVVQLICFITWDRFATPVNYHHHLSFTWAEVIRWTSVLAFTGRKGSLFR